MSLSYSSHTIGSHLHCLSASGNFTTTPINSDDISPSEQNPVRISFRTTEFVRGIEKKFFSNTSPPNIKALKDVLHLVSKKGVAPIQGDLLKKSGFFVRFFSGESWEDWTEHRTPLGRVVSLYCNYVTSSTRLDPSMSRLNKKLLEVANRDAAAILKSLRTEEEPESNKASERSFWSSFLSLPMAEASSLGKAPFPADFELSSLDGTNGFILYGEAANDKSGYSVSGAGDINGDGISDLVVGAPFASNSAGRSYVIFGSNRGWGSPLELSNLVGSNGFIINGTASGDYSGHSVSGAGDINGDGISDLVVGSPFASNSLGRSYVIFGRKGSWSSPFQLSSLNGTNGFILNGPSSGSSSGFSVSRAGDINGDGITDLVVGGPRTFSIGNSYVIFGRKGRWNSPFQLSSLNGTNGFIINGEAEGDGSGWSVSGAGDINDDRIDDLVVGAPTASSYAGRSYVIFGSKSSWSSPFKLSNLNGVNGFILNNHNGGDRSGISVSGVGDINVDGIADLVVGASGSTYVIFGRRLGWWSSPFELSSLNGKNGFIAKDEGITAYISSSVSGAGDFNGDGISDLIVGAPGDYSNGNSGAGQSYVIFGSKNKWNSPIELSSLNGTNGFTLNGEAVSDWSGYSVSDAGDVNGDGITDLVVGAWGASPKNRTQAGKSYVIFGQKTTATKTAGKIDI